MCQRNSFCCTAAAGIIRTHVTYCTIPVHFNLIPSYLNLGAEKENERNVDLFYNNVLIRSIVSGLKKN